MTDITNFVSDGTSGDSKKAVEVIDDNQEVHIRIKKRNGRKCTTMLENLNVISNDPVYWRNLFKHFRKQLCCNGSLDETEKSMLLSGDQREKIKQYLVDKKLCTVNNIKIHGF